MTDQGNYRKLLALTLLGVALLALPTLSYPPSGDQGEFATCAQQLLQGHILYTQVWDPKPPMIMALYTIIASLAGPSMLAVRLFDLGWTLLTCLLIYLLGRRLYTAPVALVAAFTFGTAYFSYSFFDLAESDGFMILPMVASVYCLVRYREAPDWRWLFGSGLALGLAFWFKYTALVMALPLALGLIWAAASKPRLIIRGVAIGGMGFALVTIGWLTYILAIGAGDEFFRTFAINAEYTKFGYGGSFSDAVELVVGGVFAFHIAMWLLALVTGASDISRWRNRAQRKSTAFAYSLMIWSWLLATLAAMLAQGKFYPYQWLPILPPLAILAAQGFVLTLDWPGWRTALPSLRPGLLRTILIALMLLAISSRMIKQTVTLYPQFLAYESGQLSSYDYLRNFGGFGGSQGQSALAKQMVADYIVAHTRHTDYIVAWGYVPDLYLLSQRQPISRFYYSYTLTAPWYPSQWQSEFLADMVVTPPTYIVIDHLDHFPFLSGHSEDSAGQLKYFPAFKQIIAKNYTLETSIEDFGIYRRNAAPLGALK